MPRVAFGMLNPPRAWTIIFSQIFGQEKRDTSQICGINMNLQMSYMGFFRWIIKIFFFSLCFPIFILVPRKSWAKSIPKSFPSFPLEAKKKFFRPWYLLGYPSKFLQSVKSEFPANIHWNILALDIKISPWLCSVTRKTSPQQQKFCIFELFLGFANDQINHPWSFSAPQPISNICPLLWQIWWDLERSSHGENHV